MQGNPTYDIDVATERLDDGLLLVALEALDDHLFATNEQQCFKQLPLQMPLCKCLVHQCSGDRLWHDHAHLLDVHAA